MTMLSELFDDLRSGALTRGHILTSTRYIVGDVRRRLGGDVAIPTKEDWLQTAQWASDMSLRYRDLAYVSALILHERHGVSERELAAALGWNRTTLRKNLNEENTQRLASDLSRSLASEGVF